MVQQLTRPAVTETSQRELCRHHWMIEAPTGPTSRGECRLCGDSREFKNYIGQAPSIQDNPATSFGSRYPVEATKSREDELDEI